MYQVKFMIHFEMPFAFICSSFVYKRFSRHPTNNSHTEIEMKDNAAYKQINLGVRPRPQTHPPTRVAQLQQEDNIYDLCTSV